MTLFQSLSLVTAFGIFLMISIMSLGFVGLDETHEKSMNVLFGIGTFIAGVGVLLLNLAIFYF